MKRERGIAQLLVLWALLLLGTLAAGFALSIRTEAQAARNGIDGVRAYYQARTGISRAIMLLSTLPADNVVRMRIEGEEGECSYRVRVSGEGGKVDINFVSGDDLLEILKKGGLADEEAESVRDAVLDWRDPDDDSRPRGAEAVEYAGLREPLRPRNGKLAGIEELRCVMGVTQEFFDRFLSRVFTVHGNASRMDVSSAPEVVLNSLPGVTREAVEEILSKRAGGVPVSPAELSGMAVRGLLTQKALSMLSGSGISQVYEIDSTGRSGRGISRTVRCLAEVGGRNSVKVLRWVDLATSEEAS